jgi:hypothetical protein
MSHCSNISDPQLRTLLRSPGEKCRKHVLSWILMGKPFGAVTGWSMWNLSANSTDRFTTDFEFKNATVHFSKHRVLLGMLDDAQKIFLHFENFQYFEVSWKAELSEYSLFWDVRPRRLLVSYWRFVRMWFHRQVSCSLETSVTIIRRCVTSEKSEDLIYTAEEAWSHAELFRDQF